jgi:hypothetical protein
MWCLIPCKYEVPPIVLKSFQHIHKCRANFDVVYGAQCEIPVSILVNIFQDVNIIITWVSSQQTPKSCDCLYMEEPHRTDSKGDEALVSVFAGAIMRVYLSI